MSSARLVSEAGGVTMTNDVTELTERLAKAHTIAGSIAWEIKWMNDDCRSHVEPLAGELALLTAPSAASRDGA